MNSHLNYLNINCLLLTGPTCSLKSSLAILLAKKFGFSIINFDSLLFYRELNIGTAKPTPKELREAPHYLINISSIQNPLNAMDFNQLMHSTLGDLNLPSSKVIIVGGSAFYLKAFLNGMYKGQPVSELIKKRSDKMYEQEGIDPFLLILKEKDPVRFKQLHPNDHYRIRRAVEYFWENNRPFSLAKDEFSPLNPADLFRNFHHFHFDIPKEEHWEMIQVRCHTMVESGLIEEVEALLKMGFSPELKPLQSIGYKETIDYIKKGLTLAELKEQLFINTRRLAKSQRTFFNHFSNREIFNPVIESDKVFKLVEQRYANEQ